MPTDIKLNVDTHDLDVSSGTLTLFTDNTQVVAQRVKIAILTKLGEFFKDANVGLPYYQEFFARKDNKAFVDSYMIRYINSIQDVFNITYYTSEIVNRGLEISVSFSTYTGEIVTVDLEVV